MVLLPKALYDLRDLKTQDYKSVDEYNSALFMIVSKLKLCGETITYADMLEKKFSTFHKQCFASAIIPRKGFLHICKFNLLFVAC